MKYLEDLEVSSLLEGKWSQVIDSIESAFLSPTADMIPKVYLKAGKAGDYRAMPAALGGYAAMKWIGVFPNNPKGNNPMGRNLPTTIGTLILNDRYTGLPLLAMDCTTLTAYRTAATSAIAAKYCAPNAEEFAFIGCGLQARYHIEAYESIFGHMNMSIELYDTNESSMLQMFNWLGREHLCHAWGRNESVEKAVKYSDVITTLTPSTEPYLNVLDIKSNCHVNAVGADAKGKRELNPNVIDKAANVICDDPEQATHSGELQYNVWPHLEVTDLSTLIKNHKNMQLNRGISVFDSTGVSIEDIAIGILIYQLYNK